MLFVMGLSVTWCAVCCVVVGLSVTWCAVCHGVECDLVCCLSWG